MGRVRAGWLMLIMLALALGGAAEAIGSVHAAGTTYFVGSAADDGGTNTVNCASATNTDCTLRDAIAAATSGADTIVFNSSSGSLRLKQGALNVANSVTITGPGADTYTIDGARGSGGFTINSGVTAAISGISIQNALTGIVNNGTLTLTNSAIYNGFASPHGGGIDNSGTLTMFGSTLAGNNANYGAAIYSTGTVSITNSSIANNNAQTGGAGGIYNDGGTLTVTNSTIAGNTAAVNPAGLYNNGTASLTNTIVADNAVGDFDGNNPTTNNHNLLGGDPKLGHLSSNGGPTETFPLQAGSPAIGTGDPVSCAASPVNGVDQRGVARPAGSCDIGAYQSQGLAPASPSAATSAAWIIGATAQSGGYTIAQYDGSVWNPISGGAVKIAVGPDGQPWVVNDSGRIFHRVNGAWQAFPGAARAIAVGADGSAWVLSPLALGASPSDTNIYHWNGSSWERVDGSASAIAVGPNGQPWVVNMNGTILHRVNGSWQTLPGAASAIAVGADGSVWVLGVTETNANYPIYHWNGSGWDQIDGAAQHIAVGSDGQPWVVNSNGNIYHRVNGAWQLLSGLANDIAVH